MQGDGSEILVGVSDFVQPDVVVHVRHLALAVELHARLLDLVRVLVGLVDGLFNASANCLDVTSIARMVVDFRFHGCVPTKHQKCVMLTIRCNQITSIRFFSIEECEFIYFGGGKINVFQDICDRFLFTLPRRI
jgi:hypothetical protein